VSGIFHAVIPVCNRVGTDGDFIEAKPSRPKGLRDAGSVPVAITADGKTASGTSRSLADTNLPANGNR
jgi:hypothetical protein